MKLSRIIMTLLILASFGHANAQVPTSPPLSNYAFVRAGSADATLTGYYVDQFGGQLGAAVSYTVSTSPVTFVSLATTIPSGAVGFVGSLSQSVYEGLGGLPNGTVASGQTPASGYPIIPAATALSWGRVAVTDVPAAIGSVTNNASATGGYTYTHISTNTTTVVKASAGTLHTITINSVGTTDTATIYDNTIGSGTVIGVINGATAIGSLTYDCAALTGISIVTSGTTSPDVTVSWK